MAQVRASTSTSSSPKQLKFKLVHFSGEVRIWVCGSDSEEIISHVPPKDPEFPASELNTHSPQTKGWQTPPFCDYPQELGLMFTDGPVQVCAFSYRR